MAWERTSRASPVCSTGATDSQIRIIVKIVRKNLKNFENVRTLPNASGCILTHPSRSVWVRMDPNALRHPEKMNKPCENMQKIAKHRAKIAKIRDRVCAVVVSFGNSGVEPLYLGDACSQMALTTAFRYTWLFWLLALIFYLTSAREHFREFFIIFSKFSQVF